MKKLKDYKDGEALDLLADLIEPVCSILADPEMRAVSGNKLKSVKMAIKNHKPEVMEILAVLNGVPVEEYHCDVLTLPTTLFQVLDDRDLTDFFASQQQQMTEKGSSIAATANTKATKKK